MMRGKKWLKKWASVCQKWKRKWIMVEIDSFDILHKKLRLVKESPDARSRRVTASRSATGIVVFRNNVSLLLILGPTKLIGASKSESDILQNVLKCKFSTLMSHRSFALYLSRLVKVDVIHHRRFLRLFVFRSARITIKLALVIKTSSSLAIRSFRVQASR
jgi:hypothetical protein